LADTVVIVPMLGRADHVERLADSLAGTTDDARLLFVCSDNDTDVVAAVARYDHLILPPQRRGDYARKVNAGIAASTEPFIFLGAIDIKFHQRWLVNAKAAMGDGVGVVGTQDLCDSRTALGTNSTHSLVARWYADLGQIDGAPGLVHEGYWHEYVDNELIAVARHRDAYAHAYGSIVEHLHWMNGKRKADGVDAMHTLRMASGLRLFVSREHLWT
jgi:glycosyltransferase involved in cell wall biosynthesis